MIWVDGLHYSPMAFLLMTAAFRSMDPSLEESAMMSGASILQIAWKITLKLAWPAALGSLLILFVRSLESFEVPALLGLPVGIQVYTSSIYQAIHQYPSQIGLAAAYAITLLLITSVGIYLQSRLAYHGSRYSTVTGKGFRPRTIDLGPLALFHRGAVHPLFRRHRAAAVPGPGVVVAAEVLQRAVLGGAQPALARFLPHHPRLSAVLVDRAQQPVPRAHDRDRDHADRRRDLLGGRAHQDPRPLGARQPRLAAAGVSRASCSACRS